MAKSPMKPAFGGAKSKSSPFGKGPAKNPPKKPGKSGDVPRSRKK